MRCKACGHTHKTFDRGCSVFGCDCSMWDTEEKQRRQLLRDIEEGRLTVE